MMEFLWKRIGIIGIINSRIEIIIIIIRGIIILIRSHSFQKYYQLITLCLLNKEKRTTGSSVFRLKAQSHRSAVYLIK